MSLASYFHKLLEQVEKSDISNQGKDKNGFFVPTKTVLLRHLQLLKDLHDKPLAKARVQDSWSYVVERLPPEWLILTDEEKAQLKEILK